MLKSLTTFILISLSCLLTAQQPGKTPTSIPLDREQLIQKATQFRADRDYHSAIIQLDSILTFDARDAQVLLFKGDLLLQYGKYGLAVQTYRQLLPLNHEIIITKINLSYALFMDHKPKKALYFAKSAWELERSNLAALVNYFNAMLWNLKIKEAAAFLDRHSQLLPGHQIMILKARLYSSSGDYQDGLATYDQLMKDFPDENYIKEYADVLLGKNKIREASEIFEKSKHFFSSAVISDFERRLKIARFQKMGTELMFFKDLSGNIRIDNVFFWEQGYGRKFQFGVQGGKSTLTSAMEEKTNAPFVKVSIDQQWNHAWSSRTDLGLQRIQATNSNDFTVVTGKQTIQYQPNDRRMAGLYYSADILYFTASLLQKNVRNNTLGYLTHLMIGTKSGIYSEGKFSFLNDANRRVEFFGSMYRLLRTEPTIKSGINFSALHFKNSNINTYFAPDRFLSSEIFVDYTSALPQSSRFYLNLQGAAGFQKIEHNNWDPVFRLQSELGIRFPHFEAKASYQTSNVASNTGTGYKYNRVSFKLGVKW